MYDLRNLDFLTRALEKFAKISDDVVIISLTFRRLAARSQHRHLQELLVSHLEDSIVPHKGFNLSTLSFQDCLDTNKNYIISYQEYSSWSGEVIEERDVRIA